MEKPISGISEKVSKYIPHDLAFFILSKLPLKSLKRFGCVHRSWALFMENHHFMSTFRNNFIRNNDSYYDDMSLLVHSNYNDIHLLSGDRFENRVKLDLPNLLQGQISLFYVFDSGSISGYIILCRQGEFILFDTTTQKFWLIPLSPVQSVPHDQIMFVTHHGFGYDQLRDDYKLIRHVSYLPPNFQHVEDLGMSLEDIPWKDRPYGSLWEIYSHRNKSWSTLDFSSFPVSDRCWGVRLYKDGICHWLQYNYGHSTKYALASFDLAHEVFLTTPMSLDIPPNADHHFKFLSCWIYLVLLNGSIAFISWFSGKPTFDISILNEIGVKEPWTKLFTIGPLFGVDRPIGTWKNGNIFFMKKDGELVRFDLKTQMMEELGFKGKFYSYILLNKE